MSISSAAATTTATFFTYKSCANYAKIKGDIPPVFAHPEGSTFASSGPAFFMSGIAYRNIIIKPNFVKSKVIAHEGRMISSSSYL